MRSRTSPRSPLHFARNQGQAPEDVRFLAQGVGYTVRSVPTMR